MWTPRQFLPLPANTWARGCANLRLETRDLNAETLGWMNRIVERFARLKRELVALYGPRLKQVLLYGSRARGDHREDSDYDVLVVLESGPAGFFSVSG